MSGAEASRPAVSGLAGHVIVVDLGYGDAGKGTVVDWLCSRPGSGPARPGRGCVSPGLGSGRPATVVRFNGGAQAAHNVVTPDGRHHTFAQFGAGTFTPGVRTHLSRFVLVDPLALAAEAAHMASVGVPDALDRLTVDREALLTTPYHRAANRARELARPAASRHGSCGMGIGETARYALEHPADAPRAGDCDAPRTLARKLALLRDWLAAEFSAQSPGPPHPRPGHSAPAAPGPAAVPPVPDLRDAYLAFADRVSLPDQGFLTRLLRAGPAVFEGAQGVLLDEWHGFHPYTTWSTTTFANAETLLAEAGQAATRLGVTRCYQTRHGQGPLVTEDPTLELAEPHNGRNQWQGAFRVGHLDAVALRYAIEAAGGIDAIALTHLDAAGRAPLRLCDRYVLDGRPVGRLPVRTDRDLARQEELTRELLRARPVYGGEAPGRAGSAGDACGAFAAARDWPDLVRDALGAPVLLLSHGPTALDKVALGQAAPGKMALAGTRAARQGQPGPRRISP